MPVMPKIDPRMIACRSSRLRAGVHAVDDHLGERRRDPAFWAYTSGEGNVSWISSAETPAVVVSYFGWR
jgi:hypothetical protein